jgi:hypothetical protein
LFTRLELLAVSDQPIRMKSFFWNWLLMIVSSRRVHRVLLVGCLLQFVISGCGPRDAVSLVPVRGVVLFDGEPVEDATLSFVPMESGSTGVARTDASGRFDATTADGRPGLPPGRYRVAVTKSVPVDAAPEVTTFADMEREMKEGKKPTSTQFQDILPKKYADPETSEIVIEIGTDGTKELTLDLK